MTDKPTYKEQLKELLIDPEEIELLEIRKILAKINKDKTVVDEFGHVKLLDITQGILMQCTECDSWQPFEVKNIWDDYLWFYCCECGTPADLELRRNI